MHLLRVESRSIDGMAEAVDLAQSPADIVVLSFADSDLSVLAAAWEAGKDTLPSLRLANLSALRHPYSVDLYVEKVLSKSRFVLVRLLGGIDYWRYGIEELATLARTGSFHLAIVPADHHARPHGDHHAQPHGDHPADARLDEGSTLPVPALRQIRSYFAAGGVEQAGECLRFIAGHCLMQTPVRPVLSTPAFGHFAPAAHPGPPDAPKALIVFYRVWMLAADTDPVLMLARELASRGFQVATVYVTSLKDEAAAAGLRAHLDAQRPDVILNLTAFSARLDDAGSVLDTPGAPVFQLALSGGSRQQWLASHRGLGPADLAMNVVLPEFDGRIVAGAISFKNPTRRNDALEFTRVVHQPEPEGITYAADLACAWAELARTPRARRRLACILSDYPGKGGRTGYAVGLDTPRSVMTIAARLAHEGFSVDPPDDEATLALTLSSGQTTAVLSVSEHERLLEEFPPPFAEQIHAAWGAAGDDKDVCDGMFCFRIIRAGNLLIAVQPDRGDPASRKTDYHDALLPPRHGYIAFYLWLRAVERVHAVIHCGTHGTLEWLPGKATALSAGCAPRAVLGPVPLIYPFIVNNPGEAAQAKRRVAAVTIGHLTPPLSPAGTHGAALELERLFDEYAEAQSLDPRRAGQLAELIMAQAWESGLAAESGITKGQEPQAALVKLDAWLCDIKDMRIGIGLHVFGQPPTAAQATDIARTLATATTVATSSHVMGLGPATQDLRSADRDKSWVSERTPTMTHPPTPSPLITKQGRPATHPQTGSRTAGALERLIASCGEAEMSGLLAALDGRFVPPGPAGAPGRGRIDVLPTGRNLYSIDPRAVPTRTAWAIGRRTAEALLTRHAQDHGEWPKRIVLDIWGSSTMRTGGDDLAQALALLGAQPRWDPDSNRVAGFDILPLAVLNRPRVDVTLRLSGLFRDVFPAQIALFDHAVREVAALDEAAEDNPLAASVRAGSGDNGKRIFGAAPGAYGIGLSRILADGTWSNRDALGEAYLQATSHSYGLGSEGYPAPADFRDRVAQADAYAHVQDMPGQDVLDADAFAEHEGGFAAAAASLGNHPALYHADTTQPERSRIRTLREEVARVLRARATNPRWLTGQMRHGFRGAAEIAQTIDNFCAYAALADVTDNRQFDLLFDATLGDEAVRTFLTGANPAAAVSIAERFEEAIGRGLWKTRRNSAASILTHMRMTLR